MELEALQAEDLELVALAAATLRRAGRRGHNRVAAALRTPSGRIFAGLDLMSRKSDICAEPVAIGAAQVAGEHEILTIVAVHLKPRDVDPHVISPCGACRELIWYHAPKAGIIVAAGGGFRRVLAREIFPFAEIT